MCTSVECSGNEFGGSVKNFPGCDENGECEQFVIEMWRNYISMEVVHK